jgi:restriction endonuclease S subunit
MKYPVFFFSLVMFTYLLLSQNVIQFVFFYLKNKVIFAYYMYFQKGSSMTRVVVLVTKIVDILSEG